MVSPIRAAGRWLTCRFVTRRVMPEQPESLLEGDTPVCYVLETSAVTNTWILDQVCREHPVPAAFPEQAGLVGKRNFFAVSKIGRWFRRPSSTAHFGDLGQLLEDIESGRLADIRLVPVTILIGRSPDKETSWFRALVSEDWPIRGRMKRLFQILVHGRNTLIEFSEPISLKSVLDENLGRERSVRKVSRVLRVHFRRMRTAAIGPDLSHRRTLVESLLRTPLVRRNIRDQATKTKLPRRKIRARARGYASEIAADYSYSVVRFLYRLFTWFWNRIYDGIDLNHLDKVRELARTEAEIVYVPCHRSHIDYMVLSYLLYHNGLSLPHVAAGVNLNLPVIGNILRGGGGFFLRRSFKANPLYSAVFTEYVNTLCARGVPLEYFIEGGRSRTGRLLPPRGGMLSMTVRSFFRSDHRPIVFQPVYIGYEKLVEGDAYVGELSGQQKKPESLGGFFRALKILKKRYGRAHVNFGEPVHLSKLLNDIDGNWRDAITSDDARPEWLARLVDDLGRQIQEQVNAAADVNPINLLALALTSVSKQALGESDLERLLGVYQQLLQAVPYGPRVTMTSMTPAEIVEYGLELGIVQRQAHALGDIISVKPDHQIMLTYYRNNVLHLMVAASWVACCFVNNVSFSRRQLIRMARLVYPFVRDELFLKYSSNQFHRQVSKCLNWLTENGYLEVKGDTITRVTGATSEALRLRILGRSALPGFERYFITLALLARHGSGQLTSGQLERLCQLTAERMALLFDFHAPEYFDRTLFRRFIQLLKRNDVLGIDESGCLTFDDRVTNTINDAKALLSKDVRHHILMFADPRSLDTAE